MRVHKGHVPHGLLRALGDNSRTTNRCEWSALVYAGSLDRAELMAQHAKQSMVQHQDEFLRIVMTPEGAQGSVVRGSAICQSLSGNLQSAG